MTKKEIKNLLKKYKISPVKRLGQNFLIDEKVLRKIIEAAELSKNDTVLEVGPGIGNLTLELAKRVKKVIAVEKDSNLVRILKNELRTENIKIIQGDILKVKDGQTSVTTVTQLCPDKKTSYKLVANLPYYITSPVIRKFLESKNPPAEMILMVQKEVAQRIVARPPESKRINPPLRPSLPLGHMSILAVSVQFYAKPEIISFVSKKSFWPQPKVDSAIIKIIPRKSALPIGVNPLLFFRIVRAGFSQPRKQLINNLVRNLKIDKIKVRDWLLKNKIQPAQRAETLDIEDWQNLTKSIKINPVEKF